MRIHTFALESHVIDDVDSHGLIGFVFLWLNLFGHGRGVLCSAHGSRFDKGTQSQLLGALYQVKLLAIEVKKIKHAQTPLK
jgi:hypothetical protein